MTRLALSFLGPFQAAVNDRPLTGFPTDKVRALLVYLAVEGDRPHRRDSLAGLLWPDWTNESALANVRKSLHRLRQTLDQHDPGTSEPLFTVTRQTVQLNRDHLTLDVATFQSLLAECKSHPHRQLHALL
jgi:DNA-binding SARP family transcriptional activator